MIKNMKAAILLKSNSDLIFDTIQLPDTLSVGQVFVKIKYSGICGSQIGEIRATKGPDKYLPHLLGHEAVGRVIDTGPGVKKVKRGDKVILHWVKSAGLDSDPPYYKWNNKKLNSGKITTFSQYSICPENRVTKISKSLNDLKAVMFGCAIPTAFGVFDNVVNIKIGNSVVIIGCGGVGLNLVSAAKFHGGFPIYALDLNPRRVKFAKKIGADKGFVIGKERSLAKILKTLSHKNKLDYIIDNTGNTAVINESYRYLDSNGTLVLLGVPHHKKNINIHSLDLHFGKKIIGVEGGSVNPASDFPRYLKFFRNKNFRPENFVDKIFSLKQINKAINYMKKDKNIGRVILECT